MASLLHHATLTHAVTPESAAKPGLISHDTLAPHLASSATARSLKLALTAFEDAEAELLTGEPDFARILDLLNTVYSTNDGELVVSWREETSHIALTTVMTCLMSCLSYACFPGQPPEEVMARLLPAYDNDVFEVFEALLAIGVRDRVAASAGMHGNVWLAQKLPPEALERLTASIFVFANMILTEAGSETLDLLDAACDMGISDARLYRLRAALNNFALSRLDQSKPEDKAKLRRLVDLIVEDCDRVLTKAPDAADAIFCKAFALRTGPDRAKLPLAITAYERFLSLVEKDDRFRPAAHYHIGFLYVVVSMGSDGAFTQPSAAALEKARREYMRGLEAESVRLPIFLPTAAESKDFLSMILMGPKLQPAPAAGPVPTSQNKPRGFGKSDEVSAKEKADADARGGASGEG